MIGTIDVEAVFKACDKYLATEEFLMNDAKARHAELMKIVNEGNAETEKLKKLDPKSPTVRAIEDRITTLQAQYEAGRKQAQMEISRKHAENMATTINDIRQMAQAIATQQRDDDGAPDVYHPGLALAAGYDRDGDVPIRDLLRPPL